LSAVGRNQRDIADGRVLRGERNRTAIVDALLELLESGELRPPPHAIAAHAGVSLRSVYQHFDDLENLYAAVVRRQFERVRSMAVVIDPATPVATRAHAFVANRGQVYERITPVRRAALLAATDSPTLQRALKDLANHHARNVGAAFAPELDRARHRGDLRGALVVATSWETWDRLRCTQRNSATTTRRVVESLVAGAIQTIR
jgi:TetR/AcrR family transcriptional regulator of autoinduction and epiphytic fitness